MKGTQPSSTSTNISKALIEQVLELTPALGIGPVSLHIPSFLSILTENHRTPSQM